MKYLSFSADTVEPRVGDAESEFSSIDDYGFPPDLLAEIRRWNDRYGEIVPMGASERSRPAVHELIRSLDEEGVGIAMRIRDFFRDKGGAKVEYYSEGLFRKTLVDEHAAGSSPDGPD